jgi:hypothetical protein
MTASARKPSLADDVHGPRRPLSSEQIAAVARALLTARDLPPVGWETEQDPEIRLRKMREFRFSEQFGTGWPGGGTAP